MPSRSFFEVPDQTANAAIIRSFSALDRHGHIDEAIANNLAPLVDEGSFAHLVGISPKLIFSIMRNPNRHYNYFPLKKRDGRIRHISAPKTYLKVIQWWILDNILNKIEQQECATGFVKGRGILYNAKAHFGAKHIYNTDIKDFFPNIPYRKVYEFWRGLNTYPLDVCEQLSRICTLNGGLPQGAPTSPSIANAIAADLDKEIVLYCIGRDFKYSRYADDITISSKSFIDRDATKDIGKIIESNGYTENERKRRFRGAGQRMEVTGLVINEKIQLSRTWRKNARAAFYQAIKAPSDNRKRHDTISGYLGALSAAGVNDNSKLFVDGKRALAALKSARSGAPARTAAAD